MAYKDLSDILLVARHKELRMNAEILDTHRDQSGKLVLSPDEHAHLNDLIDEIILAEAELRNRNVPGFRLEDVPEYKRIQDGYWETLLGLNKRELKKLFTSEQNIRKMLLEIEPSDEIAVRHKWALFSELTRLHDAFELELDRREYEKQEQQFKKANQ